MTPWVGLLSCVAQLAATVLPMIRLPEVPDMTELNVIGLIVCVLAIVGLLWLIVDARKRKAKSK